MRHRILALLSFMAFSLTAHAQEHIPFLECHYAEKHRDDLPRKDKYHQDEMVLRISRASSEFFSLWNRKRTEIQDSILAKGGSLQDVMAAREKIIYPVSTQRQAIYKNLPRKGMLTYTDKIAGNKYLYTEQQEKPRWKILKEKKVVANYPCQKAEACYLGRKWVAWFSTDIPIPEGPWKLWGLPGLILEAADSDNDYQFTCIEIQNLPPDKAITIPKAKYIKCTKEQHLETLASYKENTNQFLKRQGNSGVFKIGKDGKWTDAFPESRYNYIERQGIP